VKILITASVDYADEFDCKFFYIVDGVDAATCQADFARAAHECEDEEVYFGTNEFLTVSESDFLGNFASFKFTEISDDEAEVINRLIGPAFGTGTAYLDHLLDHMEGK